MSATFFSWLSSLNMTMLLSKRGRDWPRLKRLGGLGGYLPSIPYKQDKLKGKQVREEVTNSIADGSPLRGLEPYMRQVPFYNYQLAIHQHIQFISFRSCQLVVVR